jgi:hypothetical protein
VLSRGRASSHALSAKVLLLLRVKRDQYQLSTVNCQLSMTKSKKGWRTDQGSDKRRSALVGYVRAQPIRLIKTKKPSSTVLEARSPLQTKPANKSFAAGRYKRNNCPLASFPLQDSFQLAYSFVVFFCTNSCSFLPQATSQLPLILYVLTPTLTHYDRANPRRRRHRA